MNADPQIVGFGLHDATITKFVYDMGAGQAEVCFSTHEGRTVVMLLHGVGPLGMVGFRNGAIVSGLFAWAPADARLDAGPNSRRAWEVVFGGDIPVEDLPKAIEPFSTAKAFSQLVLIECSYGGSVAALCREVDIRERG